MSTIKVTNVNPPTAGDAVNINGLAYPTAGPLSNRNLIINGNMRIAQRGTQVTSVSTTGYRTVDRFDITLNALGTWTVDQSTDSPNGFSNSLKLTNTTADASPAATAYITVVQSIEAQNLQALGYGSSDAKALTLSFWVKSNKTGNASFEIRQRDNSNKLFSAAYSISSADTWEYKTIAIPADTSGVIDNDNGSGLSCGWWLNSGSNYTGGSVASTWSTFDDTRRNPSNLGVGGAISDYFAITGVQLEVGTVVTPFEHRSYGQELALCQRYYYSIFEGSTFGANYSTNNSMHTVTHPVTMRDTPSSLTYTQSGGGSFNTNYLTKARSQVYYTGTSGTSSIANIEVSAEL